jgi:hypothetical protein
MTIVKEIQNLYQFFENNGIDINVDFLEFESAEEAILKMTAFNNVVMKNEISSKEVSELVRFMTGRKDNLASYVLDILLTNPSFLQNEEVKKVFHAEIEDKIFDDIDDFHLQGDKLKIIDCFLNREYDRIKPLLDSLDEEDKVDVLMYIMEHAYSEDVLNKETEIGAILDEYSELVNSIYDETNLVNSGFEIEFDGEE